MEAEAGDPTDKVAVLVQVASDARIPCVQVIAGQPFGELWALEGASATIGRAGECDVGIPAPHLSRRHARILREGDRFTLVDLGSRNGTCLNGVEVSRASLAHGDKIQFGATLVLRFALYDEDELELQRRLFDSTLIDGLTRAFNRRHFHDRLTSEVAYALRHGSPLSLSLFDLDRFKTLNDTHGHLAGDEVLVDVVRVAAAALGAADLLCRFGGEEFAVLSPGRPLEDAARLAERLRRDVAARPTRLGDLVLPRSISIGVAQLRAHEDAADDLVARADRALYDAKRAGRDRVAFALD